MSKKDLLVVIIALLGTIIFFVSIKIGFGIYLKATERKSTRGINTTDYSYATGYRIGEPWVVDGMWSLTILGVTEVDYHYLQEHTKVNPLKDEHISVEDYYPNGKDPDVIYIIDYAYTNLGYEYKGDDTLYISGINFDITDTAGIKGYEINGVPGMYYSKATPIGATCMTRLCIGLDYDGPFRIVMHVFGSDGEYHTGQFIVDPKTPRAEYVFPEIPAKIAEDNQYKATTGDAQASITDALTATSTDSQSSASRPLEMGETWVVDGQWEVTVIGVTPVDVNSFDTIGSIYDEAYERTPTALYEIEYTYKNIGYDLGGYLQIGFTNDSLDEVTIIDNAGVLGYGYPKNTADKYSLPIKVGESYTHTQTIGVENPGDFTVTIKKYDTNIIWHEQTFKIDVPEE